MKKKIKFADQTTREACIARLRAVADGIEAGALGISHGDEALALRPGSAFDVEVRAEQHNEREQLSLQLSWRRMTLAIGKAPVAARAMERSPAAVDELAEERAITEDDDGIPVSVEPPTLRPPGNEDAPGTAVANAG
jgi:amphi-Trp domain-containing protein